MKLHMGSGTVYLDGWLNVDVPGPHTYLASERPDLVEAYKTTDDRYYSRHEDKTIESLRKGPLHQEYVCDAFGSFSFLPVRDGAADEFLARQCFEHLSMTEARSALQNIHQALKLGGILRLDVPDHDATLRRYRETGEEFYVRHLLGPRRDDHGYHVMSYTRETLRRLVQTFGLLYQREEKNPHFYPAFTMRFIKA